MLTFSCNTNQVVSTNVFFNVKQHLLKAFFDKIKTDHHKWLFVAEKPVLQVFFKFFLNMPICVSKDPSCKAMQQTVCKNIQKHVIQEH